MHLFVPSIATAVAGGCMTAMLPLALPVVLSTNLPRPQLEFAVNSVRRRTQREFHFRARGIQIYDRFLRTNSRSETNAESEVLFGKPGRGRQIKDWDEGKLHALGQVYFYIKKKKPAFRDRQIAEIFAEQYSDEFGKNGFGKDAELIRQRLPTAKRAFVKYC